MAKCKEGKRRSRATGYCRKMSKPKVKKSKCKAGKRRSRVTGKCRTPSYAKKTYRRKSGKKSSKKTMSKKMSFFGRMVAGF